MLTLAGPLGATSCEQWERSESSLVAENEHANTMGPGRLRCFNAQARSPSEVGRSPLCAPLKKVAG